MISAVPSSDLLSADSAENTWNSLLDEVRKSMGTPVKNASIVVVGDSESGKSMVAQRLQQKNYQTGHQASVNYGLEYRHICLSENEETVIEGTLDVWVVGSNGPFKQMLQYALPPSSVHKTLIVICVGMDKPWVILESVNAWFRVIEEHLNTIAANPGPDEDEKQQHCEADWNPEVKLPTPVLVVVTKTDLMNDLRKKFDYVDEHFEFIQMHLRMACLKYGAGLMFTSNIDRLKDGIDPFKMFAMNRCFGVQSDAINLTLAANQTDFENTFIPPGWDRPFKISVLSEAFTHMDGNQTFTDVIRKPNSSSHLGGLPYQAPLSEIVAEDHQAFLTRLKARIDGQNVNDGDTAATSPQQLTPTRRPVQQPLNFSGTKKTKSPESTYLTSLFGNLMPRPGTPGVMQRGRSSSIRPSASWSTSLRPSEQERSSAITEDEEMKLAENDDKQGNAEDH